ncbi:MAG: fimbrial protein [Nitratireductor sp.]|nr:fimbrial protein [Nitratireductor sp.]
MNAKPDFDNDEKPLDPATERVRRKLARFGAIFLGLNMLALMAVLGAIVYKLGGYGADKETAGQPAGQTGLQSAGQIANQTVPVDPGLDAMIDIPDGARVSSVSENGARLVLALQLAGGGQEVWLYDFASRQVTGKIRLH